MRSGILFLSLFLLIGARSTAAEFGSEKEGFTIRLTGDWKSVSLLSKLLDSESSRLTAFRDLTGKTPLVVHILSTDGFGDLNFNRQAVVDAHAAEISKSMLGRIERCLVFGPARKGGGMLSARTDNNRVVNFAGDVSCIGQMVNIRITDVFPHTLGGELVEQHNV